MRQFTKDWAEEFPEMTVLRPGLLISIIEPLALSVFLKKSRSDFYTPQIHMCSFLTSTKRADGVRIDYSEQDHGIDRPKHASAYKQAAEKIRGKMFLPLQGDVTFDSVKNAYNAEAQRVPGLESVGIIETPALLAGWLGLYDQVEPCIEIAREHCVRKEKVWWFDKFMGGYENFMSNLREVAFDKKRLVEIYERGIEKDKLQNVPKRYIVP
jgi:hypothetical protein